MKKPNAKTIERAKDILLVVLFFTTVLLLYFFWENASTDAFRLQEMLHVQEEENAVPALGDIVVPVKITVAFGDETYAVISEGKKDLWQRAAEDLRRVSQTSDILVEEIQKEKYFGAMTYAYVEEKREHYESIEFRFSYDIPLQEFCEYYELKKNQGFEMIEGIAAVAYSSNSPESILIHQKKGDRYYRLVADKDYTDFSTLIEQIGNAEHPTYYTVETFFGADIKNRTLLPLSLKSDLLPVGYEKEVISATDAKAKDLAEGFFNESFDFTRRIVDTKGNITYLYGYGKKVFVVSADGTFEYKEEIENSGQNSSKFFDSLEVALNFVASHGSWNSLDGAKMSAYLRKVEPIEKEKKKGYRFIFGMKIGAQNVYYTQGEPIAVEVMAGQVIYYKRNMIDFEQDMPKKYRSGEPIDTFEAVNIITQNYSYIYEALHQAGLELLPLNDPNSFDHLVDQISDMEIGYVRPTVFLQGEMELIPVYRMTFHEEVSLYFQLFDGGQPIDATTELLGQRGK